ncbi:MAG: capsular biosynthesis protein [Bacilli bacterium]|nr:capsular biosynthesis protein [Bacilli bacterium]
MFKLIKKWAWLVILVTFLATATSGAMSFYYIQPMYAATSTVIVDSHNPADALKDDYNIILANQTMIKTYEQMVRSSSLEKEVIAKLKLNMTPDQLDPLINVSSGAESEMLSIRVVNANPRQAALIANTLAETLRDKVSGLLNRDNIKVFDMSSEEKNASPISPNKKLNIAVAFILGLSASLGIVYFFESSRRIVMNTENGLHITAKRATRSSI